jgi:hypothetical protein
MACATPTRLLIGQKSRFCTQNARSIFEADARVRVIRPIAQTWPSKADWRGGKSRQESPAGRKWATDKMRTVLLDLRQLTHVFVVCSSQKS